MFLTSNFANQNISFGKTDKGYQTTDIQLRKNIREHIECQLGPTYVYSQELGKMSVGEAKAFLAMQKAIMPKFDKEDTKSIKHVDVQALSQKIPADRSVLRLNEWDYRPKPIIEGFGEIIKDKLYVGQSLGGKPEIAKLLKKSNINSVLYLLKNDHYYKQNSLDAGLNYMELSKIGNGTLAPYNYDILNEITKNPKIYANSKNREIEDLKAFIDILDGNNKDMPGPLYMGCSYVTTVTPRWLDIYKILKDQPKNKPLSQERVEKLSEFLDFVDYGKPLRW